MGTLLLDYYYLLATIKVTLVNIFPRPNVDLIVDFNTYDVSHELTLQAK